MNPRKTRAGAVILSQQLATMYKRLIWHQQWIPHRFPVRSANRHPTTKAIRVIHTPKRKISGAVSTALVYRERRPLCAGSTHRVAGDHDRDPPIRLTPSPAPGHGDRIAREEPVMFGISRLTGTDREQIATQGGGAANCARPRR